MITTMDTILETAINKESANISLTYGIKAQIARIILLKGITIYQDCLFSEMFEDEDYMKKQRQEK